MIGWYRLEDVFAITNLNLPKVNFSVPYIIINLYIKLLITSLTQCPNMGLFEIRTNNTVNYKLGTAWVKKGRDVLVWCI